MKRILGTRRNGESKREYIDFVDDGDDDNDDENNCLILFA